MVNNKSGNRQKIVLKLSVAKIRLSEQNAKEKLDYFYFHFRTRVFYAKLQKFT